MGAVPREERQAKLKAIDDLPLEEYPRAKKFILRSQLFNEWGEREITAVIETCICPDDFAEVVELPAEVREALIG